MPSPPLRILHNARCSKSRAACALLAQRGQEFEVVDYLTSPLNLAELRELVQRLGIPPSQLVRKGEAIFKAEYAGRILTEEAWLEALAAHPILLERPVLVKGDRAVVGRPPERVLELL